MELGLGLYKNALTRDNLRFAKQAGATSIVIHLVDYFKDNRISTVAGSEWGFAGDPDQLWTYDDLIAIKRLVDDEGLRIAAIENFDPAHWYDVLLDGPKKRRQLDNLKRMIRDIGRAGIPCMGYNFSIAGVWGWVNGPFARGGAMSVGFEPDRSQHEASIPNGVVWNMVYDTNPAEGTVGTVSDGELWQRLTAFLQAVVPAAEEAGVRLAAHPDDPPVQSLRGTARLVNHPDKYQRLLDILPSEANSIEFCMGTTQEMAEGDLYEALERYSRQKAISYIHCRNVRGKVPNYHEVFIDEGDIDMLRALRILKQNDFDGVLIPDHTPEMSCQAPWHAGMAFAMGYLRALLQVIEGEEPASVAARSEKV